jgi:outer membrane protein
MQLNKYILIAILIFFISGFAKSQETIDLRTAVVTAIKNDPNVSQLRNIIDVQDLYLKSSKGSLLPTLGLSGSYNRTNTFNKNSVLYQNGIPISVGDESYTNETYNVGLSTNLTLFNGLANYKNIELSRQNQATASITYEKAKYDIVIDIYEKYYDLIKKENIVTQNEQILKDAQDQLELIKEYVNVGKKTVSDIYKQDAQVAQNELDLETARNNLSKSKIALLTSMNVDLNTQFEIDPKYKNVSLNTSDLTPILNQYTDEKSLIKSAFENRYDYMLAKNQIDISKLEFDISKRNLYSPTISAFGNYNINGNHFGDIANNRIFTIGISLSYPIFEGFSMDVQSQVAEINIQQKSLELTNLEKQISSDIRNSILDLQSNYKQVEIIDRSLKSAEQDMLLSEENFRIGLGTLLDVQTATTRYNTLVTQKINSVFNFMISRQIIEYLAGRLKY